MSEESFLENNISIEELSNFFNSPVEKILCTAGKKGEPNVAIMGSPKLLENGTIEFSITQSISKTFDNIKENKQVLFMVYTAGQRARDYTGARIYAEVTEIFTEGEKVEAMKKKIIEHYGEEKAKEMELTAIIISCVIKKVRPIVDNGQSWNEAPNI